MSVNYTKWYNRGQRLRRDGQDAKMVQQCTFSGGSCHGNAQYSVIQGLRKHVTSGWDIIGVPFAAVATVSLRERQVNNAALNKWWGLRYVQPERRSTKDCLQEFWFSKAAPRGARRHSPSHSARCRLCEAARSLLQTCPQLPLQRRQGRCIA